MESKQNGFINERFLLNSDLAERLYHDFAANKPIIDYHSHLSPLQIATNHRFENMTRLWLGDDHYKWRAMRSLGIGEDYITGSKSDEEKFHAWARTVPQTIRNPLFHWTHLELKNSFGISDYLNEKTASNIYAQCNELLSDDAHSSRKLMEKYNVVYQCSTDDPIDDLAYHKQVAMDDTCTFSFAPSFRPDKSFAINDPVNFIHYLEKLSAASGIVIKSIEDLLAALQVRVDYFASVGCKISDHGLTQIPIKTEFTSELASEFKQYMSSRGEKPFSNPDAFIFHVLYSLCKMYHQKGWVQQFHLGAIRNNNSRLSAKVGVDAGLDSIGDYSHTERLSALLNTLDQSDELAKTILYNVNPADNASFATMTGNFNDGSVKGKVQYGAAWWFLDQKNGIEQHLDILSDTCLLSNFIGMLTDSRSLLSYSRHEYFRRILCNMLANDMIKGLIPNDERLIGELIENVSFGNAKEYFEI